MILFAQALGLNFLLLGQAFQTHFKNVYEYGEYLVRQNHNVTLVVPFEENSEYDYIKNLKVDM